MGAWKMILVSKGAIFHFHGYGRGPLSHFSQKKDVGAMKTAFLKKNKFFHFGKKTTVPFCLVQLPFLP